MSMQRFVRRKTVTLWQEDGEEPVSLAVRGLSPGDIAAILSEEEGAIGEVYAALTTPDRDDLLVGEKIASFLEAMPSLAARIIAHAADMPDEWQEAVGIAAGSQIELLENIAKLTFGSEKTAKKAMEAVRAFAAKAATNRPSESRTGSGD